MAAVIRITVETSGGLSQVQKDVQALGATAKESGGGFSALQEIGVGALHAVGEAVTGFALKGFDMLASAVSDGIEDAKQNAQIQAQTAQVIKSTGDAAGVSAQHVAEYASSLSDAAGTSLFGDDQIQQSTNLLLTFTEIKGATLDAATAISVDMAQALGGAPKDAAIQLGKALNDPIKGITALTRVGVTFSDEQKAQIQAMQEAGDTAGAQAVILAELNKEFGGSAAAAAAATGGWSEFNGRMGEAKEALGAAVLPLLNGLAGLLTTTLLPIIERAAAMFGEFVNGIMSAEDPVGALVALVDTVSPALGTLVAAIGDFIVSGGDLGVAIDDLSEGFQINLGGAITSLSAIWTDTLQPAIATVIATFQTQVMPILSDLATALFPLVGAAIQILAGFWTDVLVPAVQMLWGILTTVLLPILAALAGWLRDNLPGAIQATTGFLTGTLFPALHQVYDFININVIPILTTVAHWLIENVPVAIQKATDFFNNTLLPALNAIWAFIQNNVIPIIVKLTSETFTALNTGVQGVSTLWTGTLKPALDAVWQFINTYINPILNTLTTVVIAALKVQIAALEAVWRVVLLPAITAVWDFIDKNIIPIFKALYDTHIKALKTSFEGLSKFWSETFKPAMETVYNFINDYLAPKMATFNTNVLQPMKGFFDDIGRAVNNLIGYLRGLKEKWDSLKPPDWVTGHSPPPMANWFNDIGGAVAALNQQLPALQANLTAQLGPQGQSITNTASTRSFTYAPTISTSGNVSAPMDLALASSLAGV